MKCLLALLFPMLTFSSDCPTGYQTGETANSFNYTDVATAYDINNARESESLHSLPETSDEEDNGAFETDSQKYSTLDTTPKLTSDASRYTPSAFTSWHIQLTGIVDSTLSVDLYDIDLFDTSKTLIESLQARGVKVICYFSAGSYESWRSDANSFNENDLGRALDGWQNERWLDIRSDKVRSIMKHRLDMAQAKKCDGVDPDNVDAYTNHSGFNLTADDQLAFNRFIAEEAHARGLAVGLKNDLEQVEELVDHFDFAVNEQCLEYDECHKLRPFIEQNKPVLHIEYQNKYVNNRFEWDALCNKTINDQFSTLVLPMNLDGTFRFDCL